MLAKDSAKTLETPISPSFIWLFFRKTFRLFKSRCKIGLVLKNWNKNFLFLNEFINNKLHSKNLSCMYFNASDNWRVHFMIRLTGSFDLTSCRAFISSSRSPPSQNSVTIQKASFSINESWNWMIFWKINLWLILLKSENLKDH